jgi:hypothetical protein
LRLTLAPDERKACEVYAAIAPACVATTLRISRLDVPGALEALDRGSLPLASRSSR